MDRLILDELQRGRTPKSAESVAHASPEGCARRFNGAALRRVRRVASDTAMAGFTGCFNGAALRRVRRGGGRNGGKMKRGLLQRGRTPKSAERRVRYVL